jgi:redox-regulated HSP33 family molecular chaperone
MFSLEKKTVETIVARIIVKREVLGASLHEDGDLILFSRGAGQVNRLEYLAGGFAEKVCGVWV